jgi:hypothetical protein
MHKGSFVLVHLYVEGEDAPAHDFAQVATAAARQLVDAAVAQHARPAAAGAIAAAWLRAAPPGLAFTVRGVEADDDPPDA